MHDIVMTDVCPFSLGVGARHSTEDKTVYMETIIPRSSMLPCAKEKMFYTLYDGQRALNFKIYQVSSIMLKIIWNWRNNSWC